MTLQVPVDRLRHVLQRAEALGQASDLTTKATDVTGQYVDLQSRITALQASRQQYLTILAKATTVGDVLAVQDQIDAIQSQIEQLQGQLQLLTSETSYSTLTVTVGESAPPAPSRPAARVRPGPGVARQHRRLRHGRRGCHPHRRPVALRPPAAGGGPPAAAPSGGATSATTCEPGASGADGRGQRDAGHGHHSQAGGRAEVLADGHRPRGTHENRIETDGRNGAPDTISAPPAASVPVAITLTPDDVEATPGSSRSGIEVLSSARDAGATPLAAGLAAVPGGGTTHSPRASGAQPSTATAIPSWGDNDEPGMFTVRPTTTPGPPVASIAVAYVSLAGIRVSELVG